jgi:membrane protein DedA with SNARE-associated domain
MLPAVFDFLNGPVRELVTQVYEAVGYLGVALWVAIESVIVPIPSELVLPFAGFLVGEATAVEPISGGPWSFALTVLAGTAGATVGALIAYAIGAWGGRPFLERWGRYFGVTGADLDRAHDFFMRHGEAASFFGRMVPVVRSLVSFAAGVARMPLGRFVVFSFLGSLPWTALLVFAGMQLGANWETVGMWLKRVEYAVLGALVVVAIAWVWFRVIGPRRGSGPIDAEPA